jgi:drug/metabolite transporter (DMT)-like permease
LIPVSLRAVTPMLLKKASLSMDQFIFINVISNYIYWISFILYFAMALSWQFVLKRTTLSYAYPFTAISYVFLLLLGYFYFNEEVSVQNIIGSFLIILGTVIFAKHKDDE